MEGKKNTPFWDMSLSIEERLDWLLSEMTIEEKLSCLASRVPDLERLGIPAMGVGGEAAHGVEARNDQNELGTPETTTSFPQPIGMSATWDTELVQKAGEVTGTEARVLYHRHPDRGLSRWAPTVDLERDPRWGRTEEGYGEDPLLTGKMAGAYIRGMQGEDSRYLRVAATLKHFYGNNTESGRGWKNVSIDPRNRYELYLEPFRRAIEEGGAEAVMTAYNKINGIPGMLNPEVKDILKKQYGLKHAVCDGGAMELVVNFHHYYGIHAQTIAAAIKAGVDAMSDNPVEVEKAAKEAYELHLLSEEEIDGALRNMFGTKLRLGIYDAVDCNPYDMVTEADINSKENQEICKQVSREAVVLLKNEEGFLPLTPEQSKSLALIGPLGDAWYQDWYGGEALRHSTLLQGLRKMQEERLAGCGTEISFADGLDRVILRCGEKGIAVSDDGALYLSEKSDVFIKEDWGEGSLTFRCERTGKYMNTRFYPGKSSPQDMGRIAADADRTFDWFVMEIFHLIQGDGGFLLTNRFGMPVMAGEDGSLWSMKGGEQIGTAVGIAMESIASSEKKTTLSEIRFQIEVVESGIEKAVKLAKEKKNVILALGCNPMINAKEEVDRSTIVLPSEQEKLLDALIEVNPNIALVLFSNYPYAIGEADRKLPAILWSATGSQDMGDAVAETLFGQNAPAGRLNMTWYHGDESLPDIDDYDIIKGKRTYRYFDGDVLYPFGYGLTYSKFDYTDLSVEIVDKTRLKVSFLVKNTGERASDEVAQVYGIAPASRVKKPLKQLLGFQRLKDMRPSESRRVEIMVPVEEFRFYDVISHTLMVEEGCYTIYAGASSADCRLECKIAIPGQKTGARGLRQKTSADHYDDYENIVLTKGQFGYAAATLCVPEKEGMLYYRDCMLESDMKQITLHMMSEKGGKVEVLLNGETVGSWQGDTRTYVERPQPAMGPLMEAETKARIATWPCVYADVKIPLSYDKLSWEKEEEKKITELALRISGDVKLCYFQM